MVCCCPGALVCWCVGVLVCWCVVVLVCWCAGVEKSRQNNSKTHVLQVFVNMLFCLFAGVLAGVLGPVLR